MLVEFSVGNFLSFKETVVLSMVASSAKEHEATHVFEAGGLRLLKSAVIYGPNAGGKSNLLKAMSFMDRFVWKSASESQQFNRINVKPFRLSTEAEDKPSYFEIVFIVDGTRFRYGFELDQKKIYKEWLFYVPTKIETRLFTREEDQISISNGFKEGKPFRKNVRPNALFLSLIAQLNGPVATKIMKWFSGFNVIYGTNAGALLPLLVDKQESYKEKILRFIKLADFGIEDYGATTIAEKDINGFPEGGTYFSRGKSDDVFRVETHTQHRKYDSQGQFHSNVLFELDKDESDGTNKLFRLVTPLLETLEKGMVLAVDEMDSTLHPLITRTIIKFFNCDNYRNAQIIFPTHDITLLDRELFRRDQIWFVEKDDYGGSKLFSLVEYKMNDKKVRNDASYAKDYLNGKYGAIPIIRAFDYLCQESRECRLAEEGSPALHEKSPRKK